MIKRGKRVRGWICALALVLLVSGLGGCAPAEDERLPAEREALREAFLAEADAVTVSETAVSFTDGAGKQVILRKRLENPAILYASLVTLWVEAGGIVRGCVGGESATELYLSQIGRDITSDAGVTVLVNSAQASRWDMERIIAARPDFILCSTAMGGYRTISGPAEAAGIPAVAVDYDDFADYLKWFKVFCHLADHPERWETVALAALDQVLDVLCAHPAGESPRVLALFTGVNTMKAGTSSTVLGGMLRSLGADNAIDGMSESEYIEISLETVLAADPDVIFVQCHTGEADARALVEQLYGAHPAWQSLRAVQSGRVYYLDKTLFHNKPNSRFAQAYETLAGYLYGD